MVTSGGERNFHNRTPPLKERLPDVPQNRNPKVREGVGKGGKDGGPGPCSGRGPGDGGR